MDKFKIKYLNNKPFGVGQKCLTSQKSFPGRRQITKLK